jgi:uncharacterized protein (DUF433 family)
MIQACRQGGIRLYDFKGLGFESLHRDFDNSLLDQWGKPGMAQFKAPSWVSISCWPWRGSRSKICLSTLKDCTMKKTSVVHSDPDILGGTPVFVGTRVPVQALIDYIEGGHSLEEFLDDFPTVTREIAVAALEQAKVHLIADARAA